MSPNILIKEIHDPDTQIGQINKKTLTTKEKKKTCHKSITQR